MRLAAAKFSTASERFRLRDHRGVLLRTAPLGIRSGRSRNVRLGSDGWLAVSLRRPGDNAPLARLDMFQREAGLRIRTPDMAEDDDGRKRDDQRENRRDGFDIVQEGTDSTFDRELLPVLDDRLS
jgi:hypothetical protein